jgi:hypothetical protein
LDDPGGLLAWPFGDPRWPARLGLMGLLYLVLSLTVIGIPVASIALTGWMLTAADGLRAGRAELPAPGLYLRRGAGLFLVQLAYLAGLLVVAALPIAAGLRLGEVAGGLLVVTGWSLLTLGTTLLVVVTPALAHLVAVEGVAGALRPARLWSLLAANRRLSIGCGLMSLLCLDIISPIGLLACGIGLALTATYAYAVLAATIVAYDRQVRRLS